jgi:hypothetical protein
MSAPGMSWWDRLLWKRGRMRADTMERQANYIATLVCPACGHSALDHKTEVQALLGEGRERYRCEYIDLDAPGVPDTDDEFIVWEQQHGCRCVVEGRLSELFKEEGSASG